MTTVENLDPYSYGFLSHFENKKIEANFFEEAELRESPRIEYKREYTIEHILKAVCAFANTSGGHVLVGVDDNNLTLTGIEIKDNIDKDELRYQCQINDKLGFSLVECRIINIFNTSKVLLHIKVKEHQGSSCPIFTPQDPKAYHKVGAEKKEMNPQEIVSYAYIKNLSAIGIDDYLEAKFNEAIKKEVEQPEITVAIVNESMFQAEKDFIQNIGGNYFKDRLPKQADDNLSYDLLKQSGILLKRGMSSADFGEESFFRLSSSICNINVALLHIFGLSGRIFPYFGDKPDSSEKK